MWPNATNAALLMMHNDSIHKQLIAAIPLQPWGQMLCLALRTWNSTTQHLPQIPVAALMLQCWWVLVSQHKHFIHCMTKTQPAAAASPVIHISANAPKTVSSVLRLDARCARSGVGLAKLPCRDAGGDCTGKTWRCCIYLATGLSCSLHIRHFKIFETH